MPSFKYRIRYSRKSSTSTGMIPCVEDVYGVSAPSALGEFHRTMQLTSQISEFGKQVLRPKLGFEDYTVNSICLLYNSDASGKGRGEMIESAFDLPPGARNPNLKEEKAFEESMVMPFFSECDTGRLSR